MIRLELTLGRNIPDAGTVNDSMMDEFIRTVIMPLLEFGTFIDGIGFWKGEEEQCKILYVEMPESELAEMLPKFEQIGNTYKTMFRQDCVMISQVSTNMVMR